MNTFLQAAVAASPIPAGPSLLGPDRIIGMSGALLLVLALVVMLAWVAKRLGAVRNVLGRSIKVREVLAIGARERILLVDCEGQRLLIASSPAGIVRLHAFDPLSAGADLETPPLATASSVFATLLRPQVGNAHAVMPEAHAKEPDRQ